MTDYHPQIITSLADISPEEWNSCCFNDDTRHNPFLSHQFLLALEQSGCATGETGWLGQHIVLRKSDKAVGIMPLYLKNHSYGEYVFDHAWANAYTQAGGRLLSKAAVLHPLHASYWDQIIGSTGRKSTRNPETSAQ